MKQPLWTQPVGLLNVVNQEDSEHIQKMRYSHLTLLLGLLWYCLQAVTEELHSQHLLSRPLNLKLCLPLAPTSSSTSASLHSFILLHCTFYQFLMYSMFDSSSLLKAYNSTIYVLVGHILLFTVVSSASRTVPAIYQIINKTLSEWRINGQMHVCAATSKMLCMCFTHI